MAYTFDQWLLSEAGNKCQDDSVQPIINPRLKNRLALAFEAGAQSASNDHRLEVTLGWYEQKLRELRIEIDRLKHGNP